MADRKTFSGAEFVKALAEKTISEPIILEGMAKLEDDDTKSFMFSLGTNCKSWLRIPVNIVDRIELIRVVNCKDHTHPLIRLSLKEPPAGNDMAVLFTAFVRQAAASGSIEREAQPAPLLGGYCYGYHPGCPSSYPCAQQFGNRVYCTGCCIA